VELALLHVAQGGGGSSGVRKTVAELTAAQASLGHRVLLHLSGTDSFDDDISLSEGNLVGVVNSPHTGPSTVGFSLSAERWIESRAVASFGILHQHGIWQAHSHLALRWRVRFGRPTVVSPHGSLERHALTYSSWKKQLALSAYEHRNLHQASCLHATAQREIDGFRDFGLRNPIAVIPNGVSDRWIQSAGDGRRFRRAHALPSSARLLLYLSRIHPKKNLLGVLDAMAHLRDRLHDWHLIVAGPVNDPAYDERVRRAVKEHALLDRVHWVGELHGQDKRDAFAAAELLMLPTLSDNFAIVIAESLGAGVPVITTREALPWSVLEEHRCGWWVPLAPSNLAAALEQATRMPAHELVAMGRRGRALIQQRFRWIDIADQMTETYRWLLGHAARPSFVVVD
jgi:glycosyltransferase involved in cell wall biosynthesis